MCRRGSGLGRVFSRSPGSPGPKLGSGFSNSGLDIGPGISKHRTTGSGIQFYTGQLKCTPGEPQI